MNSKSIATASALEMLNIASSMSTFCSRAASASTTRSSYPMTSRLVSAGSLAVVVEVPPVDVVVAPLSWAAGAADDMAAASVAAASWGSVFMRFAGGPLGEPCAGPRAGEQRLDSVMVLWNDNGGGCYSFFGGIVDNEDAMSCSRCYPVKKNVVVFDLMSEDDLWCSMRIR